MDETREDNVASEYGFFELPGADTTHRNFILESLVGRYHASRDKDAYIAIVHRNDVQHYIMGVYDDLREALQTRFVANSILCGSKQFGQANFMMVHHISGPAIEDKVFDPKTNSIKDFDPKPIAE